MTAEDLVLTLKTFRNRHLIDARAPDSFTVVSEWDDQVSEAFKPLIPWPAHVVSKAREERGWGDVSPEDTFGVNIDEWYFVR